MRKWWMGAALVVSMAGVVAAEPGKAKGRQPQSTSDHAKRAGERVVNEAVDAVADELTGNRGYVNQGGGPPGLAGRRPPGLEKQDKTPPGWSKGKKTGWGKDQPPQESLIRRVIGGIFRRKPAPASAN